MMYGITFASWRGSLIAHPTIPFGLRNLRRLISTIGIQFASARLFLRLFVPIGAPNITCRSTSELELVIARTVPFS